MQNSKFNPDAISIVSFFPIDRQPQKTLIKQKSIIEDLDQFVQDHKSNLPKGGLIVIEQFGKKRQFVQNFWLEPNEEIPSKEKPSQKKNTIKEKTITEEEEF
jgi:hypothetical protein